MVFVVLYELHVISLLYIFFVNILPVRRLIIFSFISIFFDFFNEILFMKVVVWFPRYFTVSVFEHMS